MTRLRLPAWIPAFAGMTCHAIGCGWRRSGALVEHLLSAVIFDRERAILSAMRRTAMGGLALLAVALSPLVGDAQEVDFCTLLEARIVADDGQFVGRITTDTIAIDSLINPLGDHGSEFSQLSIFNPTGPYGGMFALLSPFNPNTFFPPSIIRDAQTLAHLTVNDSVSPRVAPGDLVDWLHSSAAELCSQASPTPTATPQPTMSATSTETMTPSPAETATFIDGTPPANTPTASPPNTMAPATAPTTSGTPPPTMGSRATSTPFEPTPLNRGGAKYCAVVEPPSTATCAFLALPIALLSLLRRRQR